MKDIKIKLKPKDTLIRSCLDLNIVNELDVNINCQIKVIKDKITVFITKDNEE